MDKIKNFKLPPLQEENFQVQREQYQQPAQPDDKVMEWQERNSWFGQDEEMTASALGLHEKLKKSGVVVGSDEYYAKLDETMRRRFPVAPATRSTAPKKIRLSPSQIAIAKKFNLTPEQYARELLKLES